MTSRKNSDKNSHAGLTVAHSLGDFVDGQERILVLKDSTILENEEEGDQLVSVQVEEDERLRKNLENKKKKPVYTGYDDEEFLFTNGLPQKTSLLPQYDEVIDGDKKESFKISEDGTIKLSEEERRKEVAQKLKSAPISLEYTKFKEISDYYTKDDKVEFKKSKTKKKKRVRTKTKDEDNVESVDAGDDEPATRTLQRSEITSNDVNFVDDDDLQAALARARSSAVKKKLTNMTYDMDIDERTNTDLVSESKAGEVVVADEDPEKVISQTSEFLKSLPEPASEKKVPQVTSVAIANSQPEIPEVVEAEVSVLAPDEPEEGEVNMQDASMQENDVSMQEADVNMAEAQEESATADGPEMKDKPNLTGVVEEEPLVSGGMAATLALLKQKGYNIKPSNDILEKERRQKEQQKWLVEQRRKEQERLQEREREKQRAKEKGYRGGSSGRDSESSYREREHLREIEARFKDYKPDINLEYVDEYGNQLTPKEEFRQLSHKFHGKSSGKAKTEKRLKKMEEQRKLKAMSSIDTPLNMATALQERQRATGSAHVVLSVGNRAVVPSSTLLTATTKSGALSKSSSNTSAANVITVNGGLTGQSMNAPEREKVTFGLKRKAEGDGEKPTKKR